MDEEKSQDQNDQNANGDLEAIRARALTALTPLVDGLDETPERKFEIIMTAARFGDDAGLLNKALDAAMALPEGAAKAEALIDIVNEVNYRLSE